MCFKSFVNLRNNGAEWLGQNDKVTRMKLDAGVRTILLLKISYHQFDGLHRSVNPSDNGSVTEEDFLKCFLDNYESLSKQEEYIQFQQRVIETLIDIAESLEFNKLTLSDAFTAFDRSGNEEVSVAEFTSFVKKFSEGSLYKKDMFKLLSSIDINFDRKIRKIEFLEFFAGIWSSRLIKLKVKINLSTLCPLPTILLFIMTL